MILAAVEDLLFRSKIQRAATETGVAVVFVRSSEEVLAQARAARPTLLLVDLDSPRLRAADIVAALKQDDTLRTIPTVGFVSHVRADLVAAARRAGIDEVVARSAFVARLRDLLVAAERVRPRPL